MPESPTVRQRRLRAELRKARDSAGLTQEQVARSLEWSLSKVIRIESGSVGISITDLKALLQHYDVASERVDEIVALARSSRERAWWTPFKKTISQHYSDLIGYEAGASIIREFEPLMVPGLLQISDYAHAVVGTLLRPERASDVDQLVEVRMHRQEILDAADPPLAFFIIDEAAIRRHVAGRQVMRRQLVHLVDMASHPHVTIEIVPFAAGMHAGLAGPFFILEFPDVEDDDVLYLENERGSFISQDRPDEVVYYREVFEQLRSISLGPEGSAVLLSWLAREL